MPQNGVLMSRKSLCCVSLDHGISVGSSVWRCKSLYVWDCRRGGTPARHRGARRGNHARIHRALRRRAIGRIRRGWTTAVPTQNEGHERNMMRPSVATKLPTEPAPGEFVARATLGRPSQRAARCGHQHMDTPRHYPYRRPYTLRAVGQPAFFRATALAPNEPMQGGTCKSPR